ncbi:MAG: nucleoside 2-deoxyribosyltransferase [Opitutaceae bacterium]|nr:nucleoside 2-deoxyribosyltransferase [Opitutaceae bacterium]
MKTKHKSYSVYFASELFSIKHLIGNAYLAEAIYERSHGRFLCRLPQDFELHGKHPKTIRDQDIRALLDCDLAVFNFDGTELDSGTVVEFMFAKFADIPAVILRSDLRKAGSQRRGNPWNLMASYYPRTAIVSVESLLQYRTLRTRRGQDKPADPVVHLAGQHATATAAVICDQLAEGVVRALNKVLALEPVMPRHLQEEVYHWLSRMPGLRGKEKALRKELERALERKVDRGLL